MKKVFAIHILTFCFFLSSYSQIHCGIHASVFSGCPPLVVSFQDSSTGGATIYFWDFDGSGTSTQTNPTSTFVNPGIYDVMHIASNGVSSDTTFVQITILVPPTVNFSSSNNHGCVSPCHVVDFINQTIPGQIGVAEYVWDFGDGSLPLHSYNASHCYNAIGNYSVTLMALDSNGCQQSLSLLNYVVIVNGPSINAHATPNIICAAPATIHFTANGSSPNGGLSYSWIFRNGGTSSLQNPIEVYTSGTYLPVVTLTDSLGCKAIDSVLLQIGATPDFYSNVQFGVCPQLPVQFYNSNLCSCSYLWDFGDGDTSTEYQPLHVYIFPGDYKVKLIVSNFGGICVDSLVRTDYIHLHGPVGNFILSPSTGAVPLTVQLTGTYSGIAWSSCDFGDGTVFTDSFPPSHIYTQQGIYYPTITLVDSNSCAVVYPVDTVLCGIVGLVEVNEIDKMNLYPNPATNQLFIETNGVEVEQINIYNTTGSLVSQTKEPQSKSIDISGLANGVYVAEVITKENSVRKRWVKM